MRILLTGATGEIGGEVAKYFTNAGADVTTLGRKPINSEIKNYSWTLGMSPNPDAFLNLDCIIHMAWKTTDRDSNDFHINVGGTSKIVEAALLSNVKIINFSSLSAINPASTYGQGKALIESINTAGINLRIAKVENRSVFNENGTARKVLKKLILVPVPSDLFVYVTELNELLASLNEFTSRDIESGTYTLPFDRYEIGEYLKRFHGFSYLRISRPVVNLFFLCCKFSKISRGKVLYDRWLSLASTNEALDKSTAISES